MQGFFVFSFLFCFVLFCFVFFGGGGTVEPESNSNLIPT